MKFPKFREFRNQDTVEKYLSVDLSYTFKELFTGLLKLNFGDNFDCFVVTATVPASGEVAIRNELGKVPIGKIIIRDGGSNQIVDGDTEWNQNFVYLKNLSATQRTVTAVFLG